MRSERQRLNADEQIRDIPAYQLVSSRDWWRTGMWYRENCDA